VRCARCRNPVSGAYLSALSRVWHPSCFRCAGCGAVIEDKRFAVADGEPYHKACYERAFVPPCSICAKPLSKKYLIDEWGNRYCSVHAKKLPSCFACGKLICAELTDGGLRYPDGRMICTPCFHAAVTSAKTGTRLLETVKATMAATGFDFGGTATPLRLTNPRELKQLSRRHTRGRPTLGMARSSKLTRGKRVVERRFEEILIMDGLPEELFSMVAAHELCHAWLFTKGFVDLPLMVEEGLCTLSEALWLSKQDGEMARIRLARLAKSDDPIYGKGYRAARKALERRSLTALLRHVHKTKRFPR